MADFSGLLDLDLRGHLDDQGFAWGSGTPWRVVDFKGLFAMALRTNDIPNSGADGSSWGTDWLDVKSCQMTLRADPLSSGLSYMTLVNQARQGLTRTQGLGSRYVWWDGLGLMMLGRVRASEPQVQPGQTHVDVAVQFTAADGLLYGSQLKTVSIGLQGGTPHGMNFPVNMPMNFAFSLAALTAAVDNAGTENAYPLIRLNGPAINPRITNLTTGETISVTFPLGAGDYLEIDPKGYTIMFNGVSPLVEDPSTVWWNLPPGESQIQFDADSYDATASAVIEWRDTTA